MASPERKISVVPPPGTEPPAGVEARLASLEGEAERLRAEVATLQDEIRGLTDEEAERSGDPAFISHGLLARGWFRASLLLAAVGFVALGSGPYLFHLLDASGRPGEPAPVAAASSVATAEPAAPAAPAAAPAATQVPPPERVPAPVRVRASEIPDPARVLTAGRGAAVAVGGAAKGETPDRRIEPSGYKNAVRSAPGASDPGPSSTAPVRDVSP